MRAAASYVKYIIPGKLIDGVLDKTDEWLQRVAHEPRIQETVDLYTVNDRDPICAIHELIVAKRTASSFADLDVVDQIETVMASPLTGNLFIEKGRLPICTGTTQKPHAHGHILRTRQELRTFIQEVAHLMQTYTAHESLQAAYAEAKAMNTPYLLLGEAASGFIVAPLGAKSGVVEYRLALLLRDQLK